MLGAGPCEMTNNIGILIATMATTASGQGAVAPTTQQTAPGPIYVDTQHEDLVHDAQLDYYGCKLATSSSGKQQQDPHPWSVLAYMSPHFHSFLDI